MFKKLEIDDFLVGTESITSVCWTTNTPVLTQFHTSSTQENSNSGNYFLSVYQTASNLVGSEKQFDIAYGNREGNGSLLYNSAVPTASYSRSIYGSYRTLIFGDENSEFVFGNTTSSHFWAISINRNRYKESLLPGSLNLVLSGSLGRIVLTDNSKDLTTVTFCDAGRIYSIVSGSNGSAVNNGIAGASTGTSLSGSYGYFLPDIGTIILNPEALKLPVAQGGIGLTASQTVNTRVFNKRTLFRAISGSAFFGLNNQETITSDYIYIRPRNSEFNYTENPSFISGSTGEVIYPEFIYSPVTYITTVGFYNDNNELLAVAKLSRPLKKDFVKEALFRVKLDF